MKAFSVFVLHSIILYCASFSLSLSSPTTLENQTDKLALLAFKSQLTESSQNTLSSWNDSLHICAWEGVTCGRRHQRVQHLNLTSRGLAGPISPNLGNLSFLRGLDLYSNSFHGNIPPQLGQLFRLELLDLSLNSLVGEIPVNISMCSNLIKFHACDNKLVGRIPTEIGFLSKLVVLTFNENQLSGGLPSSLGNLTSLEKLSIAGNSYGGSIPNTVHQMKALMFIGLDSCKLSGGFPPLYNLSALEIISLANNNLSGIFQPNIDFNLPNLKKFSISLNQFSGHLPTFLFNISGIEIIDASLNQFGGMIPSSVANFSNKLSMLALNDNQISGNIPPGIENAQSLTSLILQSNFITGIIPVGIGNLQNLEELQLGGNQLSGHIPSSIIHMSRLFHLDLSYNKLDGSIASALGNQYLQVLDLSNNNLTDNIRKHNIGESSRLRELHIRKNSINGSLPLEVGHLKYIEILDVSHNKMSGVIPPTLSRCSSLNTLSFQGNHFNGSIPSSLSLLKGLEGLDISNNNISGEIPKELEKLSTLRYLNLSNNNLEGEVPLEGVFGNVTAFSVVGNYKVCGGIPDLGLHQCQVVKSKKKGSSLAFKVVLGLLIPSFILAFMFVIYLWRKPKTKPPLDLNMGKHRRISYHDLHRATSGFSPTNLIGMGRYGSVYKGILQENEGPSAIKVFNLMEHGAAKSFMAECEALRQVRHRNLLKILTVCSSTDFNGNDFKALVFEFMPNGSLENWLYPNPNGGHLTRSLNLHQRLEIALDVASALDYLHNDYDEPIIHCDLKPSNVLLSQDMTAHVSDFGLAKFLSKSTNISNETRSMSDAIRGTIGYIPPEYGMGAEVSTNGDVYSFGLLLLELFTGKRPTDEMFKDGLSLHNFCKAVLPLQAIDIVDTSLAYEGTQNGTIASRNIFNGCLNAIVGIGVACSVEPVHERMDIKQVVKEIQSIKELLCI